MMTLATIGLALPLIAAALSDLRSRLIPNRLVAAVLALALLRAGLGGFLFTAGHLAAVAALFMACVGLFAAGAIGGGDAKLLPATALALPIGSWPAFLLATALCGGVLALVMLVADRFGRRPAARACAAGGGAPERQAGNEEPAAGVPYGVAIATGALAALWLPA